ncbi:type IV pilus modification protein PilV [Parahaliea mediterranea]|uniref:type IV pilus modification protein PilV n=1 Tax=Parahaliea mediterranea TaxID=651086 RepID=UPI00321BC564
MPRCPVRVKFHGGPPGASRQSGAGLVEVLIAVLVLAIGLLGLVGMQLAAKRASYEATQRTIATGLVRDLIERMRSNPGQMNAYVVSELGDESNPPAAADCIAFDCPPGHLAAFDIHDWYRLLIGVTETITVEGSAGNAGGLVNPRACVTNNGGNIKVAIAWLGAGEQDSPTDPGDVFGSACGLGKGLYGDGDKQRRLLVLTSYVGAP